MVAAPGTAADVVAALEALASDAELPKVQARLLPDEPAFGLRMRDLFDTAKGFERLPLHEVDRLLDHPAYEPRMAALCILDFKARRKLDDESRRELYDLYLRRHEGITTWDMVDRAAPRVVGQYLVGRSLDPLHRLARSPAALERRTAITAPLGFAKAGAMKELRESHAIAVALADDPDPLVRKAVATFRRHAGA